MDMTWQTVALAIAGLIGGVTAVIHGVIVERFMVRPIEASFLSDTHVSGAIRRVVPLLLHFSTVVWLMGGITLIVAAGWFEPRARLVTALCVGGLFLYGALGDLWATRGQHPGWMLMATALALIVASVATSPN
jgi:hypothetical protein